MWRLTRHAQLFSSKDKRVFFCLNFRTMKWLSRERSLAPSLLQCERNELSCNWTLSLITDSAVANGTWQALANILPQQKEETNEAQQLSNAKYLLFFSFPDSQIAKYKPSYNQTLYFFNDFSILLACQSPRHFHFWTLPKQKPLTSQCSQPGAMVSPQVCFPFTCGSSWSPPVFLLEGKKNY